MSDLRSVLLLVGPTDAGDIGRPALDVAARLVSSHLIEVTVAGTCRTLIRHARELGLTTVDLSSTSSSNRQGWLRNSISRAHIVHALGVTAAGVAVSQAADQLVPVVATFDDSSVGSWRSRRVRRQCDALASPVRWLSHGRLATTRLVRSGITHADNVMTLPLLPVSPAVSLAAAASSHRPDWGSRRAAARQRLALHPGTRVVLGVGSIHGPVARHLGAALARLSTPSVCFWLDTGQRPASSRRAASRIIAVDTVEGSRLLPAMDVLVADGTTVGARHPAVDAIYAGVPVIAGTKDLAAELVKHGTNGFVCDPADLPYALDAAFAMASERGLRTSSQGVDRRPLDADELTARCYASALDRPLVRPVLIGRRMAT